MRLLTADKTGLHAGLAAMADEATVYGVKRKGTGFAYGRLSAEDDLRLDYDITLLPPNKYWLPEETPLFRYEPPPKARTLPAGQSGPAIVIGVHPYDLHALKTLDAVFLGYGPDDSYKARREANVIVGVDCLHPWPYAFAPSMGTALPPEGLFDLWLTDLGDAYLIEAATEKGSALCKRYLKTRVAAKTAAPRRDELRAEALGRYRLRLDVPAAEIPRVLDAGWDSPMWEELGRKCFSCASCTMTCPTCVCFRIMDRNAADGTSGMRLRRWDSCMFDGFAEVASGENFRPTGTERLRHRLHRKGKYMLERWGATGCVGCGRCIHACLVDIASPVYAWNRLAKEAAGRAT